MDVPRSNARHPRCNQEAVRADPLHLFSDAEKPPHCRPPPQRWTGWGYEDDPEVWTKAITQGDSQHWFGDALLIAGVYEPGKTSALVYLPKKSRADSGDVGFLNVNAPYQHLESGRWHEIASIWYTSIPVLARCGAAIPVGKNRPTTCRVGDKTEQEEFPNVEKDDWRAVEIYPPPVSSTADAQAQSFVNTWLEDDGISSEAKAEMCEIWISYTVAGVPDSDIVVELRADKKGQWEPLWLANGVDIILPVGEERDIQTVDGSMGQDRGRDGRGRRLWRVRVPS